MTDSKRKIYHVALFKLDGTPIKYPNGMVARGGEYETTAWPNLQFAIEYASNHLSGIKRAEIRVTSTTTAAAGEGRLVWEKNGRETSFQRFDRLMRERQARKGLA